MVKRGKKIKVAVVKNAADNHGKKRKKDQS